MNKVVGARVTEETYQYLEGRYKVLGESSVSALAAAIIEEWRVTDEFRQEAEEKAAEALREVERKKQDERSEGKVP